MRYLTPQEEEAMLIIWHLRKGFVKEILEQYPDPHPPYTTLASTVKNLERKGYVESRRYGNTYEYTPIICEKDYKKQFMSNFVKDFFCNSYSELVTFYAREQHISTDELKEIIRIIEKQEKPIIMLILSRILSLRKLLCFLPLKSLKAVCLQK